MRLMYITPLLSTRGGIERTLIDKANYLADKKHEVLIVTYEHEGPVAYKLYPSVKHVDLDCHFFDIYNSPFYYRLFKAFNKKKVFRHKMKDLICSYCPDVIVITIPNTEIFISDLINDAQSIPVVVESHLAYGRRVMHYGVIEKLMNCLYSPIKSIKKADLLVALTEGDAGCWRKQNVSRVKVLPNPVTYYETNISYTNKSDFRIISVGRLTPQKRYDRLIDAFALIAEKYPEWYIDIYGEGYEKERFIERVTSLGLAERIHILPPTSDIYTEYKKSQFLVLSSDFEGFGLVIVEAMACGIPILSTNCPYGPSEIIEDGVTGLLSKLDVNDLSSLMEYMITHNEERKKMGEKAHHAASYYKKEFVMPLWERVYLEVCKAKKEVL